MTLLTPSQQQHSTPQNLETLFLRKFDGAKMATGPSRAPRYGIDVFMLVT